MEFLATVGAELQTQGVTFAANWGTPLNSLQMGRLRNQLREADIAVDDILTTDAYKGQKNEWWFSQGCKYCDRLIGKFSVASRDVLTSEMMTGITLSPTECRQAVADHLFPAWETALETGDYKVANQIISPDTVFGKQLTRAWIFFRSQADKVTKQAKLNPDDVDRPRLNAALLRMTQLWEEHCQSELKTLYPNRRVYSPSFRQFHELLHAALSGWDTKGQYGEHVFKAVALLAGRTDKSVTTCGPHQLAKALRVALKLLNQMIPQTGKAAKQLAVEVLEIWADSDPYFSQYAEFYGGAGQEPFELMSKFLSPVFNEWAQELWSELRNPRPFSADVPTLSARLERDYMRKRPDWGISTLIERAAGLTPTPKKSKSSNDRTPAADADTEVIKCDTCGGKHLTKNHKRYVERLEGAQKRKANADAKSERESRGKKRPAANPAEGEQIPPVPNGFYDRLLAAMSPAASAPSTPAKPGLPPLPGADPPSRRGDPPARPAARG